MPIAIGIDYEDVTQIPAYRSLANPPEIDIDVPAVTDRLLGLLDEHGVTATFFVVGALAQEYPDAVRRIVDAGHEVSSHTENHRSLVDLDDEEVNGEIFESKVTIESITGGTVEGFRAPTGRIDDRVYQTLVSAGYRYSSSVIPNVPIPRFYSRCYPFTGPVDVDTGDGSVTEFPIAVEPTLKLPLSVNGHHVEPIVVPDGSADETFDEAKINGSTVVKHHLNQGQGGALLTGFEIAIKNEAEIVVTMDADGQHPASELETLVRPIDDEADFVMGSRYRGADRSGNGPVRRAGIKCSRGSSTC